MTTTTDDATPLDVPRHDLIRGLMPMRAEDDGNVMVGYPIVFNQWTEINSWEGHFLERVLPSAPMKSMKEGRQRVQYNHGMHPVVGTSGLGKPRSMKRDSVGIYTEVPLADTSYNRDIIRPLLADGTLDGMSFRFSVVEDRWKRPAEPTDWNPEMLPERSLVEFKWFEFGPVDWPAYEAATAGIRSQAALAMWLQTPQEQRSELLRKFDISPSREQRFVVAPGWETSRSAGDDDQQDPPAGEDATGAESTDSGPDDQATRGTDNDYQPARPTPVPFERRKAERAALRELIARLDQRSA